MCITFVRQTGATDINKFTSYGCASTSTLFEVLAEITGGPGSSVNAAGTSSSAGPVTVTVDVGGANSIIASSASPTSILAADKSSVSSPATATYSNISSVSPTSATVRGNSISSGTVVVTDDSSGTDINPASSTSPISVIAADTSSFTGQVTAGGNGSVANSITASSAGPTSSETGSAFPSKISKSAEIDAIIGALCGFLVLITLLAFATRKFLQWHRAKLEGASQVELDSAQKVELKGEDRLQTLEAEDPRLGPHRHELRGCEISHELEVPMFGHEQSPHVFGQESSAPKKGAF